MHAHKSLIHACMTLLLVTRTIRLGVVRQSHAGLRRRTAAATPSASADSVGTWGPSHCYNTHRRIPFRARVSGDGDCSSDHCVPSPPGMAAYGLGPQNGVPMSIGKFARTRVHCYMWVIARQGDKRSRRCGQAGRWWYNSWRLD